MDGVGGRGRQLPQGGGAVVAQRGRLTACEDGRHPPAFARELELAKRIYARIDPAQPSTCEPVLDRFVAEAKGEQLRPRDHALLSPRELPGVSLVSFGCHSPQKPPTNVDSPPRTVAPRADPRQM
jgi:hypothetical protein